MMPDREWCHGQSWTVYVECVEAAKKTNSSPLVWSALIPRIWDRYSSGGNVKGILCRLHCMKSRDVPATMSDVVMTLISLQT